MRILVGAQTSKLYHSKEFIKVLEENGHICNLISLSDYSYLISKKPIQWFRNNIKFKKLIKEFRPNIVVVDGFSAFSTRIVKSGIPLYILLRGDYWKEQQAIINLHYAKMNCLQKFTFKKRNESAELAFSNTTSIFPICKHLEKIVNKKYLNKKTTVLYQGIDPMRWYDQPGMTLKHPCVGLLQGATIWDKTQEMLILETVLKQMPDVTFYWVGGGQYTNKILEKLEKYNNFKYLGRLDYPDKVREYLTEIDVYALITGLDMSPLTLLEAQLMKKPVVATDVGGVSELMLDGITGYLVKQGDAADVVEKLELLFSDKVKASNIGIKGRKFIEENFNLNNWFKVFENGISSTKLS